MRYYTKKLQRMIKRRPPLRSAIARASTTIIAGAYLWNVMAGIIDTGRGANKLGRALRG